MKKEPTAKEFISYIKADFAKAKGSSVFGDKFDYFYDVVVNYMDNAYSEFLAKLKSTDSTASNSSLEKRKRGRPSKGGGSNSQGLEIPKRKRGRPKLSSYVAK